MARVAPAWIKNRTVCPVGAQEGLERCLMRLRLTDKIARDLPAPTKGRLVVFDEQQPGLILRVTPNDARTFAVWFRRRSGAKEVLTLGKLGDLLCQRHEP